MTIRIQIVMNGTFGGYSSQTRIKTDVYTASVTYAEMLMRRIAIHRVKRLRWPDVFGVNHFDWQAYVRIGKCHMEKETELGFPA